MRGDLAGFPVSAYNQIRRQEGSAMKDEMQVKLLGRYIVADPAICHGKPTFRGTRIMVWQVLQMVAQGLAWETIVEECHSSISEDAIAEAITLSGQAFIKHADEFVLGAIPA